MSWLDLFFAALDETKKKEEEEESKEEEEEEVHLKGHDYQGPSGQTRSFRIRSDPDIFYYRIRIKSSMLKGGHDGNVG